MKVNLTEKEAEYLRDRPFWDWKRAELDTDTMKILAGNTKGQGSQSLIRREKFYYDLYRKLGGEIKRKEEKMKKEEIVKAIKEAYDKGYHEGFEDACDLVPTYLTEFIGNLISTLKESSKEAKCEVFDMEAKND